MQNKINVERIRQFAGEIKEALLVLRGYILGVHLKGWRRDLE